jgi:hypothetical protein
VGSARGIGPGFIGAVLDTGAQKSVIGLTQAQAYCREHDAQIRTPGSAKSRSSFKFGSHVHRSVGTVSISIPTPKNLLIHNVDVIDLGIPLLLGLDFLDEHSFNPLSVQNNLWCVDGKWSLPITRKHGHLYLCWAPTMTTHYSRAQLYRLHKHFFHPSAGKLLNLLRRGYPESLTPDTRRLLQDISSSCETCV